MVSTGARQHQHHIIIRRMKDKILRQILQMEEIINKKHSRKKTFMVKKKFWQESMTTTNGEHKKHEGDYQ
jgi:hypothetical protein